MKISRRQLMRLVKEELNRVITEDDDIDAFFGDDDFGAPTSSRIKKRKQPGLPDLPEKPLPKSDAAAKKKAKEYWNKVKGLGTGKDALAKKAQLAAQYRITVQQPKGKEKFLRVAMGDGNSHKDIKITDLK